MASWWEKTFSTGVPAPRPQCQPGARFNPCNRRGVLRHSPPGRQGYCAQCTPTPPAGPPSSWFSSSLPRLGWREPRVPLLWLWRPLENIFLGRLLFPQPRLLRPAPPPQPPHQPLGLTPPSRFINEPSLAWLPDPALSRSMPFLPSWSSLSHVC